MSSCPFFSISDLSGSSLEDELFITTNCMSTKLQFGAMVAYLIVNVFLFLCSTAIAILVYLKRGKRVSTAFWIPLFTTFGTLCK